jgi:hypothetical protein
MLEYNGIATFGTDQFEDILKQISEESQEESGIIFEEEVILSICAAGLPNMKFTDLPGNDNNYIT